MSIIKMKKQKGYSLIEIILSLALAGILTTGVTTFTIQTVTESTRTNNRMEALMQVENAGYWVSRDVQMSANITLGENAGFPMLLCWKDIDLNEYEVTYTLTGSRLQRSVVKNAQAAGQTFIAESVNSAPELTYCTYSGGMLNFRITATCGTIDVSRSYQVKMRLDLQ